MNSFPQAWHEKVRKENPQEKQQWLADYLYTLLHTELDKDYTMVTSPGTMRLQVALTNAEKSEPALSVISSIPAPYNVLKLGSLADNLATGEPFSWAMCPVNGSSRTHRPETSSRREWTGEWEGVACFRSAE